MKNTIIILTVFAVAVFMSCRKKLDIDLPETEKHIVINGIIAPDSTIEVSITESKSVLDDNPVKKLSTADVKLYENDIFIENLVYSDSGYFISSIKPEINSLYKLTVDYENLKSAEAEVELKNQAEIISVDTSLQIRITDWGGGYVDTLYEIRFNMKIKDNENTGNFYFLGITYKKPYYDFDGYNPVFAGYYEFPSYFSSNEPFFQKENIDFRISYTDGKVFNDEIFNGNTYNLTFSVSVAKDYYFKKAGWEYPQYLIIKLFEISEDIYNYAVSYNLNQTSKYDPFAQPVQVYTNVSNGLGLFSGYTLHTDTIEINY